MAYDLSRSYSIFSRLNSTRTSQPVPVPDAFPRPDSGLAGNGIIMPVPGTRSFPHWRLVSKWEGASHGSAVKDNTGARSGGPYPGTGQARCPMYYKGKGPQSEGDIPRKD